MMEASTPPVSRDSPPPTLPYHWDGECHLVANDRRSSHSPDERPSVFQDDPDFDVDCAFDKMDTGLEEIKSVSTMESDSIPQPVAPAAEYRPVFETTVLPASMKMHSLDTQLDFIMVSSKKYSRVPANERKRKRSRKTQAQLDVLIQELGDVQTVDKDKMKDIAQRTGLKEIQVYKWFWDRKPKC